VCIGELSGEYLSSVWAYEQAMFNRVGNWIEQKEIGKVTSSLSLSVSLSASLSVSICLSLSLPPPSLSLSVLEVRHSSIPVLRNQNSRLSDFGLLDFRTSHVLSQALVME
jgi:hypothetical protein